MTNTAASEARPPSCSATSMAMGMVADFGARLISTGSSAPSAQAIASVRTTLSTPPTAKVMTIGQNSCWIRLRCRCSGTASATVAGPSSMATSAAPSR